MSAASHKVTGLEQKLGFLVWFLSVVFCVQFPCHD